MQVKKFEAKTMKDALELVKHHLGPEAVILSAKDHSKGFGLAGSKSVEVTAAISETAIQKRKIAEAKLPQDILKKYQSSPARVQKDYIERAIDQLRERVEAEKKAKMPYVPQVITSVNYASIRDDESAHTASEVNSAEQRIKGAAKEAWNAIQSDLLEDVPLRNPIKEPQKIIHNEMKDLEIQNLRSEVLKLKQTIQSFKKIPQSFISMHPGAEDGIPYELSPLFEQLKRSGISNENTIDILKMAISKLAPDQVKKPAFVKAWVAKFLLDTTKIARNRSDSRFHVFVGPRGNGKTSCLVKFASHLVIRDKKRIAIITTDADKVGAAEQLRIYAQIMNVPFAIVRKSSDWAVIDQKLANVDAILVDTPGTQLKSMSEIDQMRELIPNIGGSNVHMVQSVLSRNEDAIETANRFMALGVNDLIFTNLDESVQHGLIYNFQKEFNLPLHSFGIGSNIPEDFEPATKERVVDLIFRLTKIKKKEDMNE